MQSRGEFSGEPRVSGHRLDLDVWWGYDLTGNFIDLTGDTIVEGRGTSLTRDTIVQWFEQG